MNSLIKFFYNPLNILVILLLCFVLFATLGTYKEGLTQQNNSININGIQINNTLFTGANGATANIINSNGNYFIIITDSSGNETQFTYNNPNTNNTSVSTSLTPYDSPTSTNSMSNTYNETLFYGPNGSTAEIIQLNGAIMIQVIYSSMDILTFTQNTSQTSSSSSSSPPSPPSTPSSSSQSSSSSSYPYPPSSYPYPPSSYPYPPSSYPYPPSSYPYPPSSYPPSSYPPSSYPYPPSSYPPSSYPPSSSPPSPPSTPSSSSQSSSSSSQPSFYPNQASYSSTYYDQFNSSTPTSSSSSSSSYPYPPSSYPPSSYPPSSYPPSSYPPSSYPPPPSSYPPSSSSYSSSQNSLSLQNPSSGVPNFDNDYDYSSSLPPAIPESQIPSGQEDLYILKSEIVPPVCPAPITACHNKTDTCAPCPPCGRCPEPNFECKKVPNYSQTNTNLPIPFSSPYSTFGS